MLYRSLETSAGGHLPSMQGRKLRPRKGKEQGTLASAFILDMMCLDPGTLALGAHLHGFRPSCRHPLCVTHTWARDWHVVTGAQENGDSG